jgi:protein gp37
LIEKALDAPLHWKKPSRIFVNSMSDLFHEKLPEADVLSVFQVMAKCPRHTFQILTKRPEKMMVFLHERRWRNLGYSAAIGGSYCVSLIPGDHRDGKSYDRDGDYLPNVWLGVSVEDQKTADERIPLLLQTPAAVRFVSYEPALGPVDFSKIIMPDGDHLDALYNDGADAGIDWVIVGGESGPGTRPFDIDWARKVIEQCKAAGVACFVKQLGAKPFQSPRGNSPKGYKLSLKDRKGGDISEWPADIRVREFPVCGDIDRCAAEQSRVADLLRECHADQRGLKQAAED